MRKKNKLTRGVAFGIGIGLTLTKKATKRVMMNLIIFRH